MKKFFALALSLMMAFSLVACGSGNTPAASAGSATGSAEGSAAVSDANVGVFYYSFSDTYISSVRTALDAQLEAAGLKYQDYDGNSNQTTQNEQIDTAITSGTTLLIVNLVTSGSSDSAAAIAEKAKTAGIPVIFFNRAVEEDGKEGTVLGAYDNIAFVGTDAPEAGHMQGQMIGQYVVDNYDAMDLNGDGKISYAMFKGDASNVEAIYRTQYGVEDANTIIEAAGKPALTYFDASNTDGFQLDLQGNWSAQAANEYMTTNLSQYTEANGNMIELIICNNDNMAEGCISALNAAGYNLGNGQDGKTIPVFGVDATDSAKQLIADGKMTGTIKQDADGMAEAITYLASNAAAGKDLMDSTDSYTKDTANNLNNKIFIAYQAYSG
ncbi:galactose ABC transporter substrate-binding protein [Oscillibacter ruminantium]|uniref:galactose ABC transporter substrate-binding protein n=1 Tax=Oscillibacter ruminantium TaxID=1263547 RepID=UPI003325CCD4